MNKLEPRPRFPDENGAYRCKRNAVSIGQCLLRYPLCGPDFQHLSLGESNAAISFTAIACPVMHPIGLVLFWRFPVQMIRVYATKVAVTTGMSGLMLWRRRWSVGQFTHFSGGLSLATTAPNSSVSIGAFSERPLDTIIARVIRAFQQPLKICRFQWQPPE